MILYTMAVFYFLQTCNEKVLQLVLSCFLMNELK